MPAGYAHFFGCEPQLGKFFFVLGDELVWTFCRTRSTSHAFLFIYKQNNLSY